MATIFNTDCSLVAAIFAFFYTIVNFVLFCSTVYTLYRFCKDYRVNVQKRPPKLLFYPGLLFFIFSSLALLATVRNSMSICFHGDTNYMDFNYWIYFIIFYGAQTYLLWLVLFLRLHYVFKGSVYKLSKLTVRIHVVIFIFIPFSTPIYFIILWLVDGIAYTVILLISFLFIIGFSCSLSILFIYKLFQVFKNMDNNIGSIKSKKHQQKLVNNKLLSTITKSTMLAVISLSMTLLTPITLLFGYYAISHSNNSTFREAGACLLAFCSLFDVYTNYVCILLSYNCFDKCYAKICGKCDRKCRVFCITKIMKKRSTKSGHIEIMSTTSKSSMISITQTPNFTDITPPNGGNSTISYDSREQFEKDLNKRYEHIDTDNDETQDTNTMITPYTQDTNGSHYYDIPDDINEEDEFEEDTDDFDDDDEEYDDEYQDDTEQYDQTGEGEEYQNNNIPTTATTTITTKRNEKRQLLHTL